MVTCELDHDVSGEVMGRKLPPWQALLLHRVLPSCGGFVVYLTLMCFDFALAYEHYINGDNGLGTFCVILFIFPALLNLVFTLASPPPGLQTETGETITCQKKDLRWIIMQFLNFLLFPVAALGRYCHQIFWWTEAVCASYVEDEDRTKEAVRIAHAPSPLELYLFLQAFVHAAPHAIVNILVLMAGRQTCFDKVSIQAVSIVASTLRMASTATLYRRFEREKICGRKYPWNLETDTNDPIEETDLKKTEKQNNETVQNPIEEHIYETIGRNKSNSSQQGSDVRPKTNSDLIQFSPTREQLPSWPENDSDADSGTSSDYIPNVPNSDQRSNSDDEYVRPISILEKVAPRRRDTQYTIERVVITPPPIMPAPRPGSLAVWAEKMVENAESFPTWLSAPPRHKYHDIEEELLSEPDIPRRVPRSFIRGLEPQDITAAIVQYLGWYAFFISRLLAIAAFINCVPFAAIIVLFSHYQVTLLLLIVPQASTVRRGFYIFLAFIYLFCLMEFKIRFRHVRVWHVFWLLVCTVEAVVFTGLWYNLDNQVGHWWRSFVTQVILYSLILSYMCLMVYFVLLKPRETIVYINSNEENVTNSKKNDDD